MASDIRFEKNDEGNLTKIITPKERWKISSVRAANVKNVALSSVKSDLSSDRNNLASKSQGFERLSLTKRESKNARIKYYKNEEHNSET